MKNLISWKEDPVYERTLKVSDTELPARTLYNMATDAMNHTEARLETAARALNARETARLMKEKHDYHYISNLLLGWRAEDAAREADVYLDELNYHIREHLADDSDRDAYNKFAIDLACEFDKENQ